MRTDLTVAHTTINLAAETLRRQQSQIQGYKNVLDQLVGQRDQLIKDAQALIKQRDEWKGHADNGWTAAKEWKGLSEHLQAQFAMLEQKGSIH